MTDVLALVFVCLTLGGFLAFQVYRAWFSLEGRSRALGHADALRGGEYMADKPDFASERANSAYISGFHDGLYELRTARDDTAARRDRALLPRRNR